MLVNGTRSKTADAPRLAVTVSAFHNGRATAKPPIFISCKRIHNETGTPTSVDGAQQDDKLRRQHQLRRRQRDKGDERGRAVTQNQLAVEAGGFSVRVREKSRRIHRVLADSSNTSHGGVGLGGRIFQ